MKGLKSKGLDEVDAIKKRVVKLYGMGRLDEAEFNKLNTKVNELKKTMEEVIK